jgi:hypothetical protein
VPFDDGFNFREQFADSDRFGMRRDGLKDDGLVFVSSILIFNIRRFWQEGLDKGCPTLKVFGSMYLTQIEDIRQPNTGAVSDSGWPQLRFAVAAPLAISSRFHLRLATVDRTVGGSPIVGE